jgi:exosome complex RNA-binding protein Rrp42 (RNase PH superfamily)
MQLVVPLENQPNLTHFAYRVLAQVDGKMVKPTPERPMEGIITIHSEISPMASIDYEPGR